MTHQERFYPESRFGGFTDIDGTIAFFNRVHALLHRSSVVLDVGCGRGACVDDPIALRKGLRILKGKVSKVIGIDVDGAAQDNPCLDDFRRMGQGAWPVEDDAIDLIVCDNVLEHIEDPDRFFSEARRVLKTGGYFCIRTPNRWSYVALFSRLIPNKHHSKVLRVVQDARKEEDVFPTFYRCNSVFRIRRSMKDHGFDAVVCGHEAEPSYLSFSGIAYALGVLHQRISPRFFKPTLFAFGKKGESVSCAEKGT